MKIESIEVRSNNVRGAISEINLSDKLMDIASAYAQKKRIGTADAIEAIASHIVYTDSDFEF